MDKVNSLNFKRFLSTHSLTKLHKLFLKNLYKLQRNFVTEVSTYAAQIRKRIIKMYILCSCTCLDIGNDFRSEFLLEDTAVLKHWTLVQAL